MLHVTVRLHIFNDANAVLSVTGLEQYHTSTQLVHYDSGTLRPWAISTDECTSHHLPPLFNSYERAVRSQLQDPVHRVFDGSRCASIGVLFKGRRSNDSQTMRYVGEHDELVQGTSDCGGLVCLATREYDRLEHGLRRARRLAKYVGFASKVQE